ncbi:MAG: shikimate dehydrogenase [Chthonomonas sp.]|nr:shikimate dehydrogenase [Chthonomonas sp.]
MITGGTYWQQAMPGDFAVVGDPIGHSWSPRIHQAAYQALGLNLRYEAIHVPREEFNEAMASLQELGYRGVNVTLPLKLEAYAWAESADAECRKFESANTIELATRRATNTDGQGFLDSLGSLKVPAQGRVLLLGAGGTAQSLARVLTEAGYELAIYNRTASKAESLADKVGAEFLAQPSVAGFDLILNTTSAGLSNDSMDIPWGQPKPGALVYDVIYGDLPSPLLREAALAGFRTVDGRYMLVAQAARSFEWWLQQPAPREAMMQAVTS